MNLVVIGDEALRLGAALVGVRGEAVTSAQQARERLDAAVADEQVAIVLVAEEWAEELAEQIEELKMTRTRPVVLELPTGDEPPPGRRLRDLVQQALGIGLGGGGK
jgi:V/A-type H+-transporting ATPase subunit F